MCTYLIDKIGSSISPVLIQLNKCSLRGGVRDIFNKKGPLAVPGYKKQAAILVTTTNAISQRLSQGGDPAPWEMCEGTRGLRVCSCLM